MRTTSLQGTLTPNEKLYIASDAINYSFALQLVLEMSAEVDVPSLNEAITQANSLNPSISLNSKLLKYRKIQQNTSSIKILETEWDGLDIQSMPFFHDHKYHSPQTTPHVTYLKGIRHFLIFRVFHGAMDGMGLYHWVKEVFRAWKNQPLLGSNNALTDYDFLKQQKPPRYRPNFLFDCIAPTGNTGSAHTNYLWHKITLPGRISAITAKLCHILLNLSADLGAEKTRFMIPVDLRGYMPDINTTINFANPIFIDTPNGTSWQNIYSDMTKQLANHNELQIGQYDVYLRYLPMPLLKTVLKMLLYRQNKKNQFMMSGIVSKMTINLAELDAPACKAIDGYFLPINVPISPITLIITEHNTATTICFSASNAHATQETCINFANHCKELSQDAPKLAQINTLWPTFNDTAVPYPQDKTIFALIWDSMINHGRDKALISPKGQITTYEQLQERVLAIASHFFALGIHNGDKIVVFLPKNEDMVCSMLACWYLGAAYIPIDNKAPMPWVLSLLEEVKPALVVHALQSNLDYSGLSTQIPSQITVSEIPAMYAASLNHLAYIIYTSGSSGTNKGVMINHGQLLNYLLWAVNAYRDHHEPYHTGLFTSIAFDLTVTTLFLPLITGGSLRLCSEPVTSLMVKSLLTDAELNFLKLTPSHLLMLNNLSMHSDNPITLIVGGEALACKLAKSIIDKLPAARIFNEYGPTETTVGCMIHQYNPQKDTHGTVPIGIPVANTRIYCLDSELKPVKIGQEGEIYIAGDSVGVGYLNQPEVTANCFLPDSFHPEQRMYRSGDLAKHREDGLLIYLGRRDRQIKIRGHRIELSKIENTLLAIAEILHAVVMHIKVEQEQGGVLVAYIVSNTELQASALRKKLSAMLPDYMLPKHFIFLEKLPMTINGKVDQKRLPKPESASPAFTLDAQSDLLTQIRLLFANALSLPIAMIEDQLTFEEMGGDSMQMAYLMNEILAKLLSPQQQNDFSEHLEHLLASATPDNFYKRLSYIKE